MLRFFTLVITVFVFCCARAFAADPFTVNGVMVDAQGATAIEAQTTALADGQLRAAQQLIERLTLSGQGAENGAAPAPLDIQSAAKMIRAMEIANEKRSGTRYLGTITVAFNPSAVAQYIQSQGLTLISTQARPRLVVPVSGASLDDTEWAKAWSGGRFASALTPVLSLEEGQSYERYITAAQAKAGDLAALKALGQSVGAAQVLIASASQAEGYTVTLTDIELDTGRKTSLGTVRGESAASAASAAVRLLETNWKTAATTQNVGAPTSLNLSVLYKTHSEWQKLQDIINNTSGISGARLDALSKDGAMMTITFKGDKSRLVDELSYKGVKLETLPKLGMVMSLANKG